MDPSCPKFGQPHSNNTSNHMATARSVNGDDHKPEARTAELVVVTEEPYSSSQYSSEEFEAEITEDTYDPGYNDEWNCAIRDHDPNAQEYVYTIREGSDSEHDGLLLDTDDE